VQQLKDEAEEYAMALNVLRRLVPQTNEVPTLLEQISTAARREGLEIGGIRPDSTVAGPEFDTYSYHISVSGGYHAVARFLANVGSLSRIVTPVNVSMSEKPVVAGASTSVQSGPNTGSVAAEFEVRTYVARTAAAAPGGN
jgi:type IV pilus assembly protein PilO